MALARRGPGKPVLPFSGFRWQASTWFLNASLIRRFDGYRTGACCAPSCAWRFNMAWGANAKPRSGPWRSRGSGNLPPGLNGQGDDVKSHSGAGGIPLKTSAASGRLLEIWLVHFFPRLRQSTPRRPVGPVVDHGVLPLEWDGFWGYARDRRPSRPFSFRNKSFPACLSDKTRRVEGSIFMSIRRQ